MTPRRLMEILVDTEDTIINSLALSLRHLKYGKTGSGFFNSYEELVAIVKYFEETNEDLVSETWMPVSQMLKDFKDTGVVEQDTLTRLENAVFSEVKNALRLLANIEKAKESVEYQRMWKENNDGNNKEVNNTDEEV